MVAFEDAQKTAGIYYKYIYIYLFQMVPYKEDLDFGLDILVYIPEV